MKKLSYLFVLLLMVGVIFTSCVEEFIPVESISIYPEEFTMTPSVRTVTLTATILPENATGQSVTWTSRHPDIATVDENGVVTALSEGIAVISATTRPTRDGYLSALSRITIEHNISFPIEGVVIDGVRWATRNVAAPGIFAENPHDAGMLFQWNSRIGWSSTDPMVASDGSTTWNPQVSIPPFVEWERANDPCPEGWRVPSKEEFRLLEHIGRRTTQYGVGGFLFGTAPNQIFMPWTELRDGFSGELRPDRGGFAYWSRTQLLFSNQRFGSWSLRIQAGWPALSEWEHRNSGLSIRCVAAGIDVESVAISNHAATLSVGEYTQLSAIIYPNNATTHSVFWSSNNPAVAIVDADGWVTGRSTGTATITALTEDGGKTATSLITVVETEISTSLNGVVIDGIRWATRNVDAPGYFADAPESAGMLYQWNRRVGWSSQDPLVSTEDDTTWPHNNPLGSTWERNNDPCPEGWRVPTSTELRSLIDAGRGSIPTTLNNVGGFLFGTAPNQIFLPQLAGRSDGWGTLHFVDGGYWSSSRSEGETAITGTIWALRFRINNQISALTTQPGNGMSIRCVAVE